MTLKILLADQHLAARLATGGDLAIPPRFKLVGNASDVSNAAKTAFAENVDIVLLSGRLGKQTDNGELIDFRRRFPTIAVLLVLRRFDGEHTSAAIQAGARGVISERISQAELSTALKAVMSGKLFFGSQLSAYGTA